MTRKVALLLSLLVLITAASAPLLWWQQALLGAVTLLAAICFWNRLSGKHLVSLALVLLSCFASLRYLIWRITTIALNAAHPGVARSSYFVTLSVQGLVLAAEIVLALDLVLGYFETVWPLGRRPVPLPENTDHWPSVDVLISTWDEPLPMLKATALAAVNMDWPAEKFRVCILDHVGRESVREFCASAGLAYSAEDKISQADRRASAETERAPFVALFDGEHPPVRSFLQVTMGWFERDARLALVQTPSDRAREHGFGGGSNKPGALARPGACTSQQDGKDLWGAASFEGTAAVLRRAAVQDANNPSSREGYTNPDAFALQRNGWATAFLNIPQTATISGDGITGAPALEEERGVLNRGSLPSDSTLFASGFTLPQRLCLFHQTAEPLFTLSRLTLTLAPLGYLLFGQITIPGSWLAILAFATPHLGIAALTRARLRGWRNIAPLKTTTAANPPVSVPLAALRQVHPRGRISSFDVPLSTLLLLGANAVALLAFLLRLGHLAPVDLVAFWAQRQSDAGFAWINGGWVIFNLFTLGARIGSAKARFQGRRAPRVPMNTGVTLSFPEDVERRGRCLNASTGGMRVELVGGSPARAGNAVTVSFHLQDQPVSIQARIVADTTAGVRLRFGSLTPSQDEAIAVLLYSRADAWLDHEQILARRDPIAAFAAPVRLAWRGWLLALNNILSHPEGQDKRSQRLQVLSGALLWAPLICLLVLVPMAIARRRGRHADQDRSSALIEQQRSKPGKRATPAKSQHTIPIQGISSEGGVRLGAEMSSVTGSATLPQTEVVQHATLRLQYRSGERLRASGGSLSVRLNDIPITPTAASGAFPEERSKHTIAPLMIASGGEGIAYLELPPELIVSENHLALSLNSPGLGGCRQAACSSFWLQLEPGTALLVEDLSLGPLLSARTTRTPTHALSSGSASNSDEGQLHLASASRLKDRWLLLSTLAWSASVGFCCVLGAWILQRDLAKRAQSRLQGDPLPTL